MPGSNYLRGKIIDVSLRGVPYAPPAAVYLSLHTADPTPGAVAITEVSGPWYVRQPATFAAQSTAGQTSNSNTIAYSPVTAGPVTVTHFAVWDAATLGNMLYFGQLSAQKTFSATDVPSWLPGQVAFAAT